MVGSCEMEQAIRILKPIEEYPWYMSLFEDDDKYSDHILDWNEIGDLWSIWKCHWPLWPDYVQYDL